jgi:hypothetical protein
MRRVKFTLEADQENRKAKATTEKQQSEDEQMAVPEINIELEANSSGSEGKNCSKKENQD